MNPEYKVSDQRINQKIVWAVLVFTIIYRVVASQFPNLSNTSPAIAFCFGGGLLLGRNFWWVPAVLMLSSDLLIGFFINGEWGIGYYTLMTIALFCAVAWLGNRSAGWNDKPIATLWCGALLSSLAFYVAANTFSFFGYSGYAKTFAGWWQCQTVGLPEYPPSWLFLRNMLIGDSIWCMLAGLLFFLPKTAPQTEIASSPSF